MQEHEETIKRLNEKLLHSINKDYPIGLANGKMGLCIYFYWLSRWNNEEKYKRIADQFLEDVLDNISPKLSLSVENGLSGIILGFHHLISENFIEGDVDDIFEEIDHHIFHRIVFSEEKNIISKKELLLIIYYIYVRLTTLKDEEQIFIYEKLLTQVLNDFLLDLNSDLFMESFSFSLYEYHLPVFLYVMGKLVSLEFCKSKVVKILDEYSNIFLSRMPRLHANRLYLLWGLSSVSSIYRSIEWNYHMNLLKREIDLTKILDTELKEQKIFVNTGFSGIFLLLHVIDRNMSEYIIPFNSKIIYDKILQSESWVALEKNQHLFNIHKGLFNGFPGVYLVMKFIEKCMYGEN